MRIVITLSYRFDLRHIANLLAGLTYDDYRLRFKFDDRLADTDVRLECNGKRAFVDLSDHADQVNEVGLAWCDLYLKRSLQKPANDKVRPFGLNYAGWEGLLYVGIRTGQWKKSLDMLRRPRLTQYEYLPDAPVDDVVMLQTRLWSKEETPGDEGINDERIEILSYLKEEFGDRFRGGLVDTPTARKLAPHLLTSLPSRQRDYIQWQKRARVGVYTRGLYGSTAFKLAEYLASSKCIVYEGLHGTLPTPLPPTGVYSSSRECIRLCHEMLKNPQNERSLAWDYYSYHVKRAADAMQQLRALWVPSHQDEISSSAPALLAEQSGYRGR